MKKAEVYGIWFMAGVDVLKFLQGKEKGKIYKKAKRAAFLLGTMSAWLLLC